MKPSRRTGRPRGWCDHDLGNPQDDGNAQDDDAHDYGDKRADCSPHTDWASSGWGERARRTLARFGGVGKDRDMAEITFKGNPIHTVGELPAVGSKAPDFELTGTDLAPVALADYVGSKLVLNIFHSLDTGTCAKSVRAFNERAAGLEGTKVLCVSKDLPFALNRFCGAEGIDDVDVASDFRTDFGRIYGVTYVDGPIRGLLARAVVVIDADGTVLYTEQVAETTQEPDYDAALAALS